MPDKTPGGAEAPKRRADARRSIRYPTRFSGELRTGQKTVPVNIRDISREGVMIEGNLLPGPGREVVLTANKLDAEAKVVWQRDALCGLEFAAPIEPLEIVRQNIPELARFRRQSEE